MWWFSLVKWLHVTAAIVSVGANLTYRIWIRRAATEPTALPFVLKNISLIDRRIANPGDLVLLATGLIMALTLQIPLTTPWLLTALILYSLAALLGILAYAPTARQQRALLETQSFASPHYQATARRADFLGLLVSVGVLAIVFLMVVKPGLWG